MNVCDLIGILAALVPVVFACDSCYGPINHVEHVRHVKRMQPGAQGASYGPTRPLEWGQLNFLHTTDTHGWLSGHIKERNYGADWGDYVSFSKHMKHLAGNLGVDLLIVDTGDLHDGTGFSDSTTPNGAISDRVFNELDDYDLLAPGNHELYVAQTAFQTFANISKVWGDKYISSNVQILNPSTNAWEYIGKTHRYFITPNGLRIMAFGILFDFTGNDLNVTKVTKAVDMIKQDWFVKAVNFDKPIDLFLLIGHNPARPTVSGSTFGIVHQAIRAVHANTPIQIFGGHTHIRDFAVVDQSTTALGSGRYCETLGWLSMSGFDKINSGWTGVKNPRNHLNPTRRATNTSVAPFTYSRRYLDWNRNTFQYHAIGKQDDGEFDLHSGQRVTADITNYRTQQRLGELYGCIPDNYCKTCVPFDAPTNIFTFLSGALTSVVNPNRSGIPRMLYGNTGSVRFDMFKGPFTYDDNFIVAPYRNVFLYIPEVPYSLAQGLLAALNTGPPKKRDTETLASRWAFDSCVNPEIGPLSSLEARDSTEPRGITRRQVLETAGFTTKDDFGTDGDDTHHTAIPEFKVPNCFLSKAGFPASGDPEKVDVVFYDFIKDDVLKYLGPTYNGGMVTPYISSNFTTQEYLIPYVKRTLQAGLPNCPF